jgi:F-type H+-transporting ATPase subunit delta
MKQSPQAAARRYARALLEVAIAGGNPGQLRAELQQVSELLASSPELLRALTHPALGVERRQRLVRALFGGRGSALLNRLLGVLAEKDRIALLPTVAAAFARVWNEHQGVVSAEAVSAQPLDEAQIGALKAALQQATGNAVELKARVDPGVLGGLVVTMGGRTYDGSVRAQLLLLRGRLVQEAAT